MTASKSRLRHWREQLGKTTAEQDSDELREDADRLGGTPADQLADRQLANVCGAVRSVTLPPKKSVPMLVVELYDGSGPVNLVWLGRRGIGGIEPGTYLRAHGRVTRLRGVPTIYNPRYEIVPNRGRG